jgi:hypothetical protein
MMKANGLRIEDSDSEEDEDQPSANEIEDSGVEEDEEGTGVMTSQLRHFVIQVSSAHAITQAGQLTPQEYIPRPLLFDIGQHPHDPESALSGYKVRRRRDRED